LPRSTVASIDASKSLGIRAVRARGERIRDAVDSAYAEKYNTAGSIKCVRGFRRPKRRGTTLEFVPRWALARTIGLTRKSMQTVDGETV
jgi:hypothetical protein